MSLYFEAILVFLAIATTEIFKRRREQRESNGWATGPTIEEEKYNPEPAPVRAPPPTPPNLGRLVPTGPDPFDFVSAIMERYGLTRFTLERSHLEQKWLLRTLTVAGMVVHQSTLSVEHFSYHYGPRYAENHINAIACQVEEHCREVHLKLGCPPGSAYPTLLDLRADFR